MSGMVSSMDYLVNPWAMLVERVVKPANHWVAYDIGGISGVIMPFGLYSGARERESI